MRFRVKCFSKGWLSALMTLGLFSITAAQNKPRFIENKGQMPPKVAYKLRVANADLYFEKDRLTFNFYAPHLLDPHADRVKNDGLIGHAYQMMFLDASSSATVKGSGQKYGDYVNYIRKDVSVGHVPSFTELEYTNIYDGVDIRYFEKNGHLEYDVSVDAGADPNLVQFRYNGTNGVSLKNGRLMVVNSFGIVEESIPEAFQTIDGKRRTVDCQFALNGDVVSFVLPNGYDRAHGLIIDPTLIFSSYTGSTADNFGFTATYDHDGALYGGGIVFGLGYPFVTGSYSDAFGGVVDMSISKFSPDGSTLEYSTYIGGSSTEAPHSMIVNSQGQLVILGSTSSLDFPTVPNSYDATFNGGTSVNYTYNGANFENGSDIVVVVLSADGSSLVGSTYIGGFLNDGLNENPALMYNYNDVFRGEVITDANDNIYIASSTESANLPGTGGTLGPAFGGAQDAFVAKFNSDVSSLEWATYLGGNGADAGYSMKLNALQEIYVTGGTVGQGFPIAGSTLHATYQGGQSDGFVAHLSNDGTTLISSSYLGTTSYDQSYFVEVDDDGNVYLYGQSTGSYPVTSGTYSNLSGKQFIQKLTPDLSTSLFSTVFGSGGSSIDISPTAFLVDICKRIYVSGWGGVVNNAPYAIAGGHTNGMAITGNAFQSTTDGDDFYFMVLEADATSLLYGSYFGGAASPDHVDGGTSRFDRSGIIYEAVCAACGTVNDFPVTPGAWSEVDGTSLTSNDQCNLGVAKLDFEITVVNVDITGGGTQSGCAPLEVEFSSDIINATQFVWYFGDGDTSVAENPVHVFTDPGVYQVMLVGTDTSFCTGEAFTDTAFSTITVSLLTNAADAGPDVHLCPGDVALLGSDSISGYTYSWSPATGLDDPSVAQPHADPGADTEYELTIMNAEGCEDRDTVQITVFNILAYPDTSICANDSVQVSVIGGSTFLWEPTAGVSDPASPSPYITAGQESIYTVTATDTSGCVATAQVNIISVDAPTAAFDIAISQSCTGDSVHFINLSENAEAYMWNLGGPTSTEESPFVVFQAGAGPLVTLTAYNNGNTCPDSVMVDYSDGWFNEDSVAIRFPNVFTPNGDDVNECFRPDPLGDLADCYTLKIFSRWGRLLFDSEKDGRSCWDGTQHSGDAVAEGTYYYIANVRGTDYAGYVTVIYK